MANPITTIDVKMPEFGLALHHRHELRLVRIRHVDHERRKVTVGAPGQRLETWEIYEEPLGELINYVVARLEPWAILQFRHGKVVGFEASKGDTDDERYHHFMTRAYELRDAYDREQVECSNKQRALDESGDIDLATVKASPVDEKWIDEHTIEGPGYFRTCCPSCGCEYTFNHADFGTTVCSCEKQLVRVDCGRPRWSSGEMIVMGGVPVPPVTIRGAIERGVTTDFDKDLVEQVAIHAVKRWEGSCDLKVTGEAAATLRRMIFGERCGDYDSVNPAQRTRPSPSTGFEQTMATRVEQALAVLKGER